MSRYTQKVIDLVYRRGCVKRKFIVDEIVEEFGTPAKTASSAVDQLLKRLVKRGVVVRKGGGLYCAPTAVKE